MNEIITKISSRLFYFVRKNLPTILTVTSITASGAAIVAASIAGHKIVPVIKDTKKQLKDIEELYDDNSKKITKATARKCVIKTLVRSSEKVLKIYAPTVLLYGCSIASTIGNHNVMTNRNAALAAAYASVKAGYSTYRNRVIEKYGEDADEEILKGIKETKKQIVDKNTGETKEITVLESNPIASDFVVMFDDTCPGFTENLNYNLALLIAKENSLTMKLKLQGYLFMEDVWKTLGYEMSWLTIHQRQQSKIVGWIYDPTDSSRDNRVSFGLTNPDGSYSHRAQEIIRCGQPGIMLEFNPDGDILTGGYDENGNHKKTFMMFAKC